MYITDIHDEDVEISVKVVIVGNGAVGKSSMIQRYCRGIFTKNYKKTIGVDFLEKQLRVHGEDVRLMLWDTAGQEEFDSITKAYYRGAQACVVTFSTTDRDSFFAVRKWKKKVEDECGNIPMVLVQNKIDLIQQSAVDQLEAERLASESNMLLYRTSVKEDLNVGTVFQHLAENYVNQVKSYDVIDSSFPSFQIGSQRPAIIYQNGYNKHDKRNKSNNNHKGNNNHNNHFNGYSNDSSRNGSLSSRNGNGGNNRGSNMMTRRFSNYADPCTDYLNNPMFDSLHSGRRYWPGSTDRTITLKPLSLKKHAPKGISLKSACRVL